MVSIDPSKLNELSKLQLKTASEGSGLGLPQQDESVFGDNGSIFNSGTLSNSSTLQMRTASETLGVEEFMGQDADSTAMKDVSYGSSKSSSNSNSIGSAASYLNRNPATEAGSMFSKLANANKSESGMGTLSEMTANSEALASDLNAKSAGHQETASALTAQSDNILNGVVAANTETMRSMNEEITALNNEIISDSQKKSASDAKIEKYTSELEKLTAKQEVEANKEEFNNRIDNKASSDAKILSFKTAGEVQAEESKSGSVNHASQGSQKTGGTSSQDQKIAQLQAKIASEQGVNETLTKSVQENSKVVNDKTAELTAIQTETTSQTNGMVELSDKATVENTVVKNAAEAAQKAEEDKINKVDGIKSKFTLASTIGTAANYLGKGFKFVGTWLQTLSAVPFVGPALAAVGTAFSAVGNVLEPAGNVTNKVGMVGTTASTTAKACMTGKLEDFVDAGKSIASVATSAIVPVAEAAKEAGEAAEAAGTIANAAEAAKAAEVISKGKKAEVFLTGVKTAKVAKDVYDTGKTIKDLKDSGMV